MADIRLYNVVEGSSCLFEYHGSPGDIVAVTPYTFIEDQISISSKTLRTIRGIPLVSIRDSTFLQTNLTFILLTETQVIVANINGICHLVIPSDGVPAGASIVVKVEVVNYK